MQMPHCIEYFLTLSSQLLVRLITALALLALLHSGLYKFVVMLLFGCSRRELSVGVFT